MTHDPLYGHRVSADAYRILRPICRRGGSMRLRPLLRELGMAPAAFIEAATELRERYWIKVVWRKPPPGTADAGSRPYTEVERLVSTRLGRRKYRTTWPAY